MNQIIFIGALNYGKTASDGETIKNQHLVNFFESSGYQVIKIDTFKWRSNPFILIKLIFCLIVFKKRSFILSVSNYSSYSFLKLVHKLGLKRKIYYWVIGGSIADAILAGKYPSEYYKTTYKIIAEGDKIKQTFEKCGIMNVSVAPNFKAINYIPEKTFGDPKVRFIFLSRIIPEKGVNIILDAVMNLNERISLESYEVSFYGSIDEKFKDNFLDRVSQIRNVHYKGFIDLKIQENYDELAKYDVMLFPTYWQGEGFPGIIIDSFIAGIPIIASDWNINKNIIKSGVTGIILESNTAKNLADEMLKFINSDYNIKKMAEYCQSEALNYKVQNVLNPAFLKNIDL